MEKLEKELTELLVKYSKENKQNSNIGLLITALFQKLDDFKNMESGKILSSDTILNDFQNKVLLELTFQDQKWGSNRSKHPLEWQSILLEEVGEVAQEINDNNFQSTLPDEYETELIQVAACAFRMYQQNKVNLFGVEHKKQY